MCIVQTYTHESATIKAKPTGVNGVIQVDYFGLFTDAALDALLGRVLEEGARGRVMVIRMDRAMMAFTRMSARARERLTGSTVPGAVVVRPDQLEAISAICSELAESGVLRVVFHSHDRALSWANALAVDLAKAEEVSMPRCRPLSEERDRYLVGCQRAVPANEPVAKSLLRR